MLELSEKIKKVRGELAKYFDRFDEVKGDKMLVSFLTDISDTNNAKVSSFLKQMVGITYWNESFDLEDNPILARIRIAEKFYRKIQLGQKIHHNNTFYLTAYIPNTVTTLDAGFSCGDLSIEDIFSNLTVVPVTYTRPVETKCNLIIKFVDRLLGQTVSDYGYDNVIFLPKHARYRLDNYEYIDNQQIYTFVRVKDKDISPYNDVFNSLLDFTRDRASRRTVFISKGVKGEMISGHKYIKRTGTPGNYRYWYFDEKGRLYSTDRIGHERNGSPKNEEEVSDAQLEEYIVAHRTLYSSEPIHYDNSPYVFKEEDREEWKELSEKVRFEGDIESNEAVFKMWSNILYKPLRTYQKIQNGVQATYLDPSQGEDVNENRKSLMKSMPFADRVLRKAFSLTPDNSVGSTLNRFTEVSQSTLDKFKKGDKFKMTAFSSFQVGDSYASAEHNLQLQILGNTHGKRMSEQSEIPSEFEIIVPDNIEYEIVDIFTRKNEENKDVQVVQLREINPKEVTDFETQKYNSLIHDKIATNYRKRFNTDDILDKDSIEQRFPDLMRTLSRRYNDSFDPDLGGDEKEFKILYNHLKDGKIFIGNKRRLRRESLAAIKGLAETKARLDKVSVEDVLKDAGLDPNEDLFKLLATR